MLVFEFLREQTNTHTDDGQASLKTIPASPLWLARR